MSKNPIAVAGGKARMKKMSPKQKSAHQRKAADARWAQVRAEKVATCTHSPEWYIRGQACTACGNVKKAVGK